jgi:hypothetical protein
LGVFLFLAESSSAGGFCPVFHIANDGIAALSALRMNVECSNHAWFAGKVNGRKPELHRFSAAACERAALD